MRLKEDEWKLENPRKDKREERCGNESGFG